MTLKEANRKLEQFENDYNYWLNEKEKLLSLISPKATDIRQEVVDGGKREDRLLKYAELEDEKQINNTLDYIQSRKLNLIEWIENELKILMKYGEVESVIIQLKEKGKLVNGVYTPLTWDEISAEVHWSKSFCRNVYRKYKHKRYID